MNGKLYLLPTILSPDAIDTIPNGTVSKALELKYLIAENIRTTRRFLKRLDKSVDIDSITFFEFNKKTETNELDSFLAPVHEGHDIGIISEAGCPGIADPGQLIIRLAHQKGIHVVPMTGPSSIFLALMASGLNGQSFRFHGYLPIDEQKKRKYLRYLEQEANQRKETQIFMETPFRNNKMIETILRVLNPYTTLCLAVNITGENESIQTKTINEWKIDGPDFHKQPCIYLLL